MIDKELLDRQDGYGCYVPDKKWDWLALDHWFRENSLIAWSEA